MSTQKSVPKVGPTIKDNIVLQDWTPAQIATIEGAPREAWDNPKANDLQEIGIFGKTLRPLMRSRPFQFFLMAPTSVSMNSFLDVRDFETMKPISIIRWIRYLPS